MSIESICWKYLKFSDLFLISCGAEIEILKSVTTNNTF